MWVYNSATAMEPETLRVAAVQLQSQDNVEQNLEVCRRLVSSARREGAKLVLLPENFAYFGADAGKHAHAERLSDPDGKIQRALAELARSSEVFLVAGGFPGSFGRPCAPVQHGAASWSRWQARRTPIARSTCSTWR